jgi:hypothetical protein
MEKIDARAQNQEVQYQMRLQHKLYYTIAGLTKILPKIIPIHLE